MLPFKKRTIETVTIPIYDADGNLIGENPVEDGQTVTQDEIPAQVNRLYVYNTYTFIQFVPDDTANIPDIRPSNLGKQDKNGYYDYDKRDYYNDDYHQSFVIENKTGNIYSVEDKVHIETIHNGLLKVKDSDYVWDCRIKDNNELEIFTLFQNTTVEVYDYYKDKYSNNYIYNSGVDTIDPITKTIYFIQPDYHVALSGEVLYIKGNGIVYTYGYARDDYMSFFTGSKGFFLDAWNFPDPQQISIMEENCMSRAVTDTDELYFNGYQGLDGNDITTKRYISHLKNKKLFYYQNRTSGRPNNHLNVINTDNAEIEYRLCFDWDISNANMWAVSYDTVVFINGDPSNKVGTVYYYKINYNTLPTGFTYDNGYKHWRPAENFLDLCTLLMENVYFTYPTSFWAVNTINSRDEYTFVLKDVNGEKIPIAVKISEYVAEDQQVITLKPINR
jgi:hypothetical protein